MNYAIFDMDDTLCTLEHRRNKAMESGKIDYSKINYGKYPDQA